MALAIGSSSSCRGVEAPARDGDLGSAAGAMDAGTGGGGMSVLPEAGGAGSVIPGKATPPNGVLFSDVGDMVEPG